ncbi:MAG: hypothetical protein ACK4VN_11880 [Bacteroidales bacterium]
MTGSLISSRSIFIARQQSHGLVLERAFQCVLWRKSLQWQVYVVNPSGYASEEIAAEIILMNPGSWVLFFEGLFLR